MWRSVVMIVLWSLCSLAIAREAQQPKSTKVTIRTAQTSFTRPVVSFHELRQAKLVRQSWDTSCGAAALSTLLTYHLGIPASEYAIATLILRGQDPRRVRERGGFSLLDLKRFVESIGLAGEGYGSMSLGDLETRAAPAIVPIKYRNLDHFVVFRGRAGDRVLLGDPAFGNITMPVQEFEFAWRSRIAFYVQAKSAPLASAPGLDVGELDLPIPDLAHVSRLLRGAGPAPAMRQLPVVARAQR